MAEDGLLHTTELIKTALPYVDMRYRLTLELLLKLYELIICIRNFSTNDISACGFKNEKGDIETLLNNIRPKCSISEQAFIDKILNIFQAKRMFEMYNTYMEAMKAMEGFEGFAGSSDDKSQYNDSGSLMDYFKDYDFTSVLNDEAYSEASLQKDYSIVSDPASETDNTDDLFESIKSMIPPDQMKTFENLRMLFEPKSYDDNNKPYENKE